MSYSSIIFYSHFHYNGIRPVKRANQIRGKKVKKGKKKHGKKEQKKENKNRKKEKKRKGKEKTMGKI